MKSTYSLCILLAAIAPKLYAAGPAADTIIAPQVFEEKLSQNDTTPAARAERKADEGRIAFSKLNYQATSKIISNTELEVLQQKVAYKTTADFVTDYRVTDTTSENFVAEISINRLSTEVETMGIQMNFSSDSIAEQSAGTSFAKDLYDMVGKAMRVEFNNAGIIIQEDTSGVGSTLGKAMAMLYSGNEQITAGSRFPLIYRLPGVVAEGDSWQDSVTTSKIKNIFTYTVQSFFRDKAVLQVNGDVLYAGEIESNGRRFNTEFTGKQTGTMEVNLYTGLVHARKIKIEFEGSVLMDNNKIPAKSSIDITEILN